MRHDHVGCFDEFFDPYLDDFVSRIRSSGLPAAAVTDLRSSLLRSTLMPLGCRVLIHEFHERYPDIAKPNEGTSAAAYQDFAAALDTEPMRAQILESYPEMDRLLRLRVATTATLISTCVQRLGADRAVLTDAGLWPGAIETISLSDGDSHNGGQRVLLVHGTERSLVYKPRPVDIDLFFADVVERIRSWSGDVDLHPVHTVAGRDGDYGWQEFVAPAEFPTSDAVRTCYRAAGQWLGLFHMLGSTDLHHENVIADGAELRFIDLETALGHITPDSFEGLRDHHSTLNQSVLGTMLLPGAMANSVFDVSIAGLTTGETDESAQRTTFDVHGLGTDGISFRALPLSVTGTANAVRSGGEVHVPMEYADEIEAGYGVMLDLLHRNAVELEAMIRRYASGAVRKVLRPTAIYGRFLEASIQPRYLTSTQRRRELLGLIKGTLEEYRHGNFPAVHAAEVDAMADFDVPYFSCRLDSTALLGNRRTVIEDYFPRPHVESLTELLRTRCASREPLSSSNHGLFNRSIIHQSMASATRAGDQLRGSTFLSDRVGEGSLADRVGAIAEYLVAIHCADDLDPHYWISPQPLGVDRWVLDKAGPTLMDGGGIAAFLRSASTIADVPGAADLASGYWKRSIEPTIDRLLAQQQLSLFDGLASYQVLATAFAEEAWGGRESAVAALVRDQAARPPAGTGLSADFTYGLAGIGYVRAATAATTSEPVWEPAVLAAQAHIRTALEEKRYDGASEVAHGDLGMLLGLAAWTRQARDGTDSEQLLHTIRRRAMDPRERPARPGWCRGQHGSLAASVVAHAMLGVPPADNRRWHGDRLEELVAQERRHPVDRAVDITLCHGLAGEADSLLTAADVLELPDLRPAIAAQLCEGIEQAMRSAGGTGGQPYGAGTPSYLLGVAGVGHVFARLLTGEPSLLLAAVPAPALAVTS